MDMRSIKECIEVTEVALWSCAHSCAVYMSVDEALKMAEATEKLSRSLNYLKQLESEEK